MKKSLLTVLTLLAMFALAGCGSDGAQSRIARVDVNGTTSLSITDLESTLASMAIGELDTSEAVDLGVLREEEKVARDVYRYLYALYGTAIFDNIADAEQTHTDAVLLLLERYGLDDPAREKSVGVFENEALQQLYNALALQGETSLIEALIVGAAVEDLDIYDIRQMKSRTDNADILLVYDTLEKGSRNHLRAFVGQIERLGGTYTPQYIGADEYEAIIASPLETGGASN